MEFKQSVQVCLRDKYADFSGRAPRSEYWWFALFYAVLICALYFLATITALAMRSASLALILGLVIFLVCIGMVVPSLAVTVRRLHDVGKSGWFWFISLVPVVGSFILLYFLVQPSQPQPNVYGEIHV